MDTRNRHQSMHKLDKNDDNLMFDKNHISINIDIKPGKNRN